MNPTVFELLSAGRRRQAAHTAIVACGKLCDACAKISFKPLHQTGYAFRSDADPAVVREYEKQLFHFHHCCIACVKKASVAGCRLCALFLARLSINLNIEYEKKLGSALSLPGAGVWVVLRQRNMGIVIATDGRPLAAGSQQTNWSRSSPSITRKSLLKLISFLYLVSVSISLHTVSDFCSRPG
jgi:hypothetical protein